MNDKLPVYTSLNRLLWDRWAVDHEQSEFYDVSGFKAGASSLKAIEKEEVGSVDGASLLHLQCHFGLDTLSWARQGAYVTGIDFSEKAIEIARSLSVESSLPARFILSDVYELPSRLSRTFDIVFTSYGAICWLPDLYQWGEIIARYLKPGGFFYMVEFHPLVYTFADDGKPFQYPYFKTRDPIAYSEEKSYGGSRNVDEFSYTWNHSLGSVVTALTDAGLQVDFLHEFPFSPYNCFSFLEAAGLDRWVVKDTPRHIPLVFSVRAHKPLEG